MKWGVFYTATMPIQIVPCDEDGYTEHYLYEDCPCHPEANDDGVLIHHQSLEETGHWRRKAPGVQ